MGVTHSCWRGSGFRRTVCAFILMLPSQSGTDVFVHGIQSVLLNNEVQKLANLGLFWSDNVASFDTLPTHQNRAIESQHEIKTDLIYFLNKLYMIYQCNIFQYCLISKYEQLTDGKKTC